MKKIRIRKHKNDQNHTPNQFNGGNPRYRRQHPDVGRGMGRAGMRHLCGFKI